MTPETHPTNDIHPLLPNAPVGLPFETIQTLSDAARHLYDVMFDYCTYAADPQYQQIHKFRQAVTRIASAADRDVLMHYFNTEPAIQDHNMTVPAWQYYADPY